MFQRYDVLLKRSHFPIVQKRSWRKEVIKKQLAVGKNKIIANCLLPTATFLAFLIQLPDQVEGAAFLKPLNLEFIIGVQRIKRLL